MEGHYTYALMGPTSEHTVACDLAPDTFVEVLRGAMEAIGVRLDELVLRIYVQEGAGGWQLVHGRVKDAREAQQTCLLPMPPEPPSGDPEVLDDATYQDIGYAALNLYRVLWQSRQRIKASSLKTKVRVRQSLRALDERMRLVEQAVEGTEWWDLFRLRYQQGKKLVACAMELHMSSRTLNRQISDMAGHVGRMLSTVLKERELAELMQAAKRVPMMPGKATARVIRLEQRELWS
ncbi:hypothetical protein [Alicyclobacillus acidocaldarius]|uniref:Uncharacterized protein n=1 Tax=Alicyclobacillus acidocaldarius subsp. acidocaldarius (strain ATCC 27009 / DSM 446 / BCRC 14685 / JCM 5260 / KCTC 1825 / NBRC 15652 / NCIMB 11725 / NRRL B-14509 / 104-IA) TaxID=521098 RepID=C8WY61_ALIAD|nr:hypothetical protein [Alicyclobacillus acidocaldarius]ACV59955.1 hypothetical protein Aaci_2952 [Alicyclobacillus acidocaldarius subsp. acidocaldarius DSM 446]